MKTRKEAKADNNRDFLKKGTKSQDQFSKNQFISSVEEPELNKSVEYTHKDGYKI
jgi:hypothetical protein